MPRIAHTADIHIRSLSRHDEYRATFKRFIEDCRTSRVDHIFVGGDIFHTKTTGISPEYIDLLTWWLKSMADVAHVHMILGNHDGNLVNLSRQDAVSPIVDALGNPKVHLYKKSGVYEIEPGFNFCVFSLFDEEGWDAVEPQQGKVNIACFHGSIRESLTETDWKVEEGLDKKFFEKYPFVFLGDIHRRQNLAHRFGRPIMAYPGTLIQQNYAEEIDHGYLLWDIKSTDDWTVKYRSLPNERPFVTIDWTGDVSSTMQTATEFPVGSRFRIYSPTSLRQDETHRLSELLKSSMSALEVTYKCDEISKSEGVELQQHDIKKSDLRSEDVINKLFNSFHEDMELTKEDKRSAALQIKQCMQAVSEDDDIVRGSNWSLKQLKWDNTFIYGEGNVIDFDKLRGIVGIFGANRTGKSSIVGTLMYSLFNTTDRGPMKNLYVCNVRKPHCYARAVLSHDGRTYVVERQTTKSANKRGVISAATSLNLFRMRDDGELDDLCGEQRNDTEQTLRSLIGNSDDFLMTSLAAQGEISQFINQGSSKRRSIISKFLDLDIFDKLHEVSNKELNALKSQLRNFPERDWDALAQSSTDELAKLNEEINSLTDEVSEAQSAINLLRNELSTRNVSPVTNADVIEQENRVLTLQKKRDELLQKKLDVENEIVDLQTKLTNVKKIVDANDVEELRRRRSAQRTLEDSILKLRHVFERETTLLDSQKKSLQILEEVPCGDEFPTCKFIKDAHINKSRMGEQSSKVTAAASALKSAEKSTELISDPTINEKITRHEKAVDLMSRIKLELASKDLDIEKIKTQLDVTNTNLSSSESKLEMLRTAIKNDENIEVVSIRTKLDELSSRVKRLDEMKISSITKRGKLSANVEHMLAERDQRDSILSKMKIQELVTTAFSKRGIPLSIMKSQLPTINAEIARILHGIVDFTIQVENDESTDALEIYINYGDSRRIIELCSGMEKTIAAIAMRVAMINVSSLPKSDIFVIDEGFGTLDAAGVESCNRLLASLKRHFKTVIVITHVDGIKDSADHIIDISKREKDAFTSYT